MDLARGEEQNIFSFFWVLLWNLLLPNCPKQNSERSSSMKEWMNAWLVRMEGYLKGWGKADGDSTCNSGASEKPNPLEMAFHHHLPHQNLAPSFLLPLPLPLPPPAALQQPGNSLVPETALQPVSSHHHHYHNNKQTKSKTKPLTANPPRKDKKTRKTHTPNTQIHKRRDCIKTKTQNTISKIFLVLLVLLDNRRVPKNKTKKTHKKRKNKKRSRAAAAKERERERERERENNKSSCWKTTTKKTTSKQLGHWEFTRGSSKCLSLVQRERGGGGGGGGGVGKMDIAKQETRQIHCNGRDQTRRVMLFSLSLSLSLRESVQYHSLWHIITNYISIL